MIKNVAQGFDLYTQNVMVPEAASPSSLVDLNRILVATYESCGEADSTGHGKS